MSPDWKGMGSSFHFGIALVICDGSNDGTLFNCTNRDILKEITPEARFIWLKGRYLVYSFYYYCVPIYLS